MSDTPKATMTMSAAKCEVSEEQRAKARTWMAEHAAPNSSDSLLSLVMGYAAAESSREHERAEGLAKELEALRAQMVTTLVFAPPDATHKCAGKCGTFWDCRYNAAQKDCPNCGGQLIPAAQASSSGAARVAELEATLAHIGPSGGVEQCRKVEARANAAGARVAELEKQLADKEAQGARAESELADVLRGKDEMGERIAIELDVPVGPLSRLIDAAMAKLREQVGAVGDRELLLRGLVTGVARWELNEGLLTVWGRDGAGICDGPAFDPDGFPVLTESMRAALNDALTKAAK